MIIKDEAAFRKYYVVFERPVGSQCWTLAHKLATEGKPLVFLALTRSVAVAFAKHVHERKPNNCSRIATVMLPEGIDHRPYAEL
jgi:hypothetical protein